MCSKVTKIQFPFPFPFPRFHVFQLLMVPRIIVWSVLWSCDNVCTFHTCLYSYQISGVAIDALLKLICAHLPQQNHSVSSMYKLRKFSSAVFPDIKTSLKYFCSACNTPLQTSSGGCSCGSVNVGKFVIADIQSQLKEKFKGMNACVHYVLAALKCLQIMQMLNFARDWSFGQHQIQLQSVIFTMDINMQSFANLGAFCPKTFTLPICRLLLTRMELLFSNLPPQISGLSSLPLMNFLLT